MSRDWNEVRIKLCENGKNILGRENNKSKDPSEERASGLVEKQGGLAGWIIMSKWSCSER